MNNLFGLMEIITDIGIDLVDVKRFYKKPYSSNQSFYKKIFTDSEIRYCLKFKNSSEHFAGKFAIKESIKKALTPKIKFLDIVTSHSNSKSIVTVKKKPYEKYTILSSISHENGFAIGLVLVQKPIK